MPSLNKATLIGHLGKDPEVRSFQNGARVLNFSLATSEGWKDKESGERKSRTQWHNVSIFNDHLGQIAEKHLKKGSKVYLEGQIESRKYTDKNDVERIVTEIVLRPYSGELVLLDGKETSGKSSTDEDLDDGIPF